MVERVEVKERNLGVVPQQVRFGNRASTRAVGSRRNLYRKNRIPYLFGSANIWSQNA